MREQPLSSSSPIILIHGDIIPTKLGQGVVRVLSKSVVTEIILQSGEENEQELLLLNQGGYSIFFARDDDSNLLKSGYIAPQTALYLIWDANAKLWERIP